MGKNYNRPALIAKDAVSGFCPGCTHGTIHKLIAEVIEEMHMEEDTIRCLGIGCSGLGTKYLQLDYINCAHGRALAAATAVKRLNPDKLVFTYQGDGDLAAIGLAETVSAAARGENVTVIFVNNSTYGMTGGQIAPTTLVGMKATTAPLGRTVEQHGYPLHILEMLDVLDTPAYLTRVTCSTPAGVKKTKQAIKDAFTCQLEGKGFSMVEVLSNCPTNWGLSPSDSLKFIDEHTSKEFPLGEVRNRLKESD